MNSLLNSKTAAKSLQIYLVYKNSYSIVVYRRYVLPPIRCTHFSLHPAQDAINIHIIHFFLTMLSSPLSPGSALARSTHLTNQILNHFLLLPLNRMNGQPPLIERILNNLPPANLLLPLHFRYGLLENADIRQRAEDAGLGDGSMGLDTVFSFGGIDDGGEKV